MKTEDAERGMTFLSTGMSSGLPFPRAVPSTVSASTANIQYRSHNYKKISDVSVLPSSVIQTRTVIDLSIALYSHVEMDVSAEVARIITSHGTSGQFFIYLPYVYRGIYTCKIEQSLSNLYLLLPVGYHVRL